jgi:hypothetical protein
VEFEGFVFQTHLIQGLLYTPEMEETPATTTVFLEGWVTPVARPDAGKKLYYFLLKLTKAEKLNL